MGACFECLVEVDGLNVQSCMTPVVDGMRVTRVRVAQTAEWKAADE